MIISVNKTAVAHHTEWIDMTTLQTDSSNSREGERDMVVAPAGKQMIEGIVVAQLEEMPVVQTGKVLDGMAADGIANSQVK